MIYQKFVTSRQTLPSQLSFNQSESSLKIKSSELYLNPYRQKMPLRFPKNKNVRRQTQMNVLIQTIQNPQKLCIRSFKCANKTQMFDHKQVKRISKPGMFSDLSRSMIILPTVKQRTFQDIGAKNNQRKVDFLNTLKPDPIVFGEPYTRFNSSLQKVWKEDRHRRDQGSQLKKQLNWSSKLTKKHPYVNKIQQKKSINNGDLLNYKKLKR